MLGQLPRTLTVNNRQYNIRTDFRDVLKIIAAYNDPGLLDREKVYVCMKNIFVDFADIPSDFYQEAYNAAVRFIEGGIPNNGGKNPKVVNWVKDEHLIFPEINKVAGYEVRETKYLHWWSFLGYFQAVDRDGLWGAVLSIRHKRATGKSLETHEKEFFRANRALCSVEEVAPRQSPEDELAAIYESLLKGVTDK